MSANFLLPEASARRGDGLLIVIPGSPSTLINYYMDTPILITFWTEPAVTFMKLMNRTVTLLITINLRLSTQTGVEVVFRTKLHFLAHRNNIYAII